MTTLLNPLCIGRKKWAGRRSGTVKFMSNGGWTGRLLRERAGAEPGLECLDRIPLRFHISSAESSALAIKSSRDLKCL